MPSKSVPLTPIKVWKGHQPSLEHIHIWECPAHVLKPKVDKLETRFKVHVLRESFEAIPKEHEIDPIDYDEAMSSDETILWQGATKVELESMYTNRVWDLVEALEEIKPIGCKWFYKRERGADGRLRHIRLGW
ncbi:hypothetical protein CK203_019597 [Vitis vinifera]|uniref:Uncharacterized protein n=1 Tax=Vitis vinifera TaxID=29760 RepID=A0A438JQI3_VITVI|nr:hypothetical protein CK203_019597 [Vitis vinifera]